MPDHRARLRLLRTGGIAGVPAHAELDTAELPAEEARPVLDALAATDLDALAARGEPGPGPPDAFRYQLEVERGDRRHCLAFTDADLPGELRPVIRALNARSRLGQGDAPHS